MLKYRHWSINMQRFSPIIFAFLLAALLMVSFIPVHAEGLPQPSPTQTPVPATAEAGQGMSFSQWALLICGGLMVIFGIILTAFNQRQRRLYRARIERAKQRDQ